MITQMRVTHFQACLDATQRDSMLHDQLMGYLFESASLLQVPFLLPTLQPTPSLCRAPRFRGIGLCLVSVDYSWSYGRYEMYSTLNSSILST